MAQFSRVFSQLFECFAHFLHRRETPQKAQQCAEQELAAGYKEAGEKKRKKRKRKERRFTGPTPLLVEVKPLHSSGRSSFLKPIEGELPKLPSVSGHLALPDARFKILPPVTKPSVHPQKPGPAPEDVFSRPCSPLQVDPAKLSAAPSCPDEVVSFRHSSSQMHPLRVPPRPTPAPDELFCIRRSSSQVRHPKGLPPCPTPAPDEVVALRRPPSRKPQPFTSPFEPPPQLMLVDIEDEEEENEYVEHSGKTILASDLLKSERSQTQAEIKPRKMFAWLEKDREVQKEEWASEVEEIQGFEEEEGDPSEMGDSKAMSQIDDHMMRLFCVTSPDASKSATQHNGQKKCKRKVPLFLFTWAEKAKNQEERKIIKEKQRREKELLRERYTTDPKLKHLRINKHNRNYNAS